MFGLQMHFLRFFDGYRPGHAAQIAKDKHIPVFVLFSLHIFNRRRHYGAGRGGADFFKFSSLYIIYKANNMFSGRFFGSWRGGRRAAFFAVCEGRLRDAARRENVIYGTECACGGSHYVVFSMQPATFSARLRVRAGDLLFNINKTQRARAYRGCFLRISVL